MSAATQHLLLLWTIDKLEQSLVTLRSDDHQEAKLRVIIEEAIETGYEVVYARTTRSSPAAEVIKFPSTELLHRTLHPNPAGYRS